MVLSGGRVHEASLPAEERLPAREGVWLSVCSSSGSATGSMNWTRASVHTHTYMTGRRERDVCVCVCVGGVIPANKERKRKVGWWV